MLFPRALEGPGSITLKRGWASFLDTKTVEVTYPGREAGDGEGRLLRDRHRVQAPGLPRHQRPTASDVINSDGILGFKKFPKRILIVGAGIIGCEYATIFSNYQQTKVHLLDRQARVLPVRGRGHLPVRERQPHPQGRGGLPQRHPPQIDQVQDGLEVTVDYEDGRSHGAGSGQGHGGRGPRPEPRPAWASTRWASSPIPAAAWTPTATAA